MRHGLHSSRDLREAGLSRGDVNSALERGDLRRVRRGWYADATASTALATAARVGGRLTCTSALAQHGVWTLPAAQTHVRVADGNAVRRTSGCVLHWSDERVGPGLDDVAAALKVAATCADLRSLVVMVDSIAHLRLLSASEIRGALDAPRGRRALALHDPTAESGIETLIRLALRARNVRLRSQVTIPGVGRVDLLIGDRLVVELDGREWHGAGEHFERDRARDRELVRRGFVVIRATYRQVIGELDVVVGAILDVVRREEHRWRSVHLAQLSLR